MEKANLSKKEDEDEYKPPTSSLQRTLQEIESSIQSEKRKLGSHDNAGGNDVKKSKDNHVRNKPTGTPEYNPTPLYELKKKKIKEKLGKSKYDLALLDEPSAEGEYDPASNFSTGCKPSYNDKSCENSPETLPDYANVLHGVKRPAEDDVDEDDSPLAKIPKFVSVEYTPTVNDSVEYSDEDAAGDMQGSFSEANSDEGSDSERLLNQISKLEKGNMSKEMGKDSDVEKNKDPLSPIEFTAEGFVKNIYIEQNDVAKFKKEGDKKDKPTSSKKQAEDSKGNKKRKEINIFSLFEDEFDSALEKCDSGSTPNGIESKVKLKDTSSSHKTHHSSENKSGADSDTKHKSRSHHKGERHSSSKSHDKSSSSSHKSHTKQSSSRTDKESNSTSKHKSSKDSSSSSSKHKSSSSRNSSSSKSDHKSSKSGDHKKYSHSNDSRSNGKYSDSTSKHKTSDSKSSKDKASKKKHIMNVDVDLFSQIDSDLDATADHHAIDDDDLADLDKYFMDEDPFEECLKIFNEDNKNRPSTSSASDKKV